MKAKFLLVFLMLAACGATAQVRDSQVKLDDPAGSLRHPAWNLGVWADYGNGVGVRSDVHIVDAGARFGRVLTGEHGNRWLRGTFEYDVDLTPVEIYHFPSFTPIGATIVTPAKNYYTGGLTPFIAKWNFTRGRNWVPFVAAEGGIVFSNGDLPQGNTANVNFTSGAAFGFHRFTASKNAWTFQGKVFHLSNASLGPHNPGVNAAVQFKVGYTWFKR
jgi:lipid A 3-O-deacylase